MLLASSQTCKKECILSSKFLSFSLLMKVAQINHFINRCIQARLRCQFLETWWKCKNMSQVCNKLSFIPKAWMFWFAHIFIGKIRRESDSINTYEFGTSWSQISGYEAFSNIAKDYGPLYTFWVHIKTRVLLLTWK